MTDHIDLSPPDIAPPPRGRGPLLAAGVVSAVALGVGLGLWARPTPPPLVTARGDAPRPALQIVFDDTPAPLGPLLEVLPGDPTPAAEPSQPPADLIAPRRPAAGLMKVDAVVAAEPPPAPPRRVASKPVVEPKPAPKVDKPPRVQTAQAKPKPKTETLRLSVARAKPADKPKAAKKLAKAETPTKAEKAKVAKLAQATAKRETALKAKAEARRVAALAKTTKAAKAEAAKRKVQLAEAKAQKARKIEKASVKIVVAKAPAAKPKSPVIKRPGPVGQGPLRVARNDACASADLGQAVVCADRRLGARDRQLQRAYRDAEAAGVPASALQRQQARWLQARAAAAREAPWAVEDVYEARISELNDLTRDAQRN